MPIVRAEFLMLIGPCNASFPNDDAIASRQYHIDSRQFASRRRSRPSNTSSNGLCQRQIRRQTKHWFPE